MRRKECYPTLMRLWMSLVVLCVCLVMGRALRADGPFHFKLPAGWKDVSSGDIGETLSKFVRPEFAEQIRKANIAIYAFDPATGPAENMNVVLSDGAAPLTDSVVKHLAANLSASSSKMIGAKAELMEAETFELHGVRCGRVTYRFVLNDLAERGIVYLLPSATQLATVTFTAPEDVFEQHSSLYEASVAATDGIAQPATGLPVWMYGVIGAIAAAAAGAATRRKARDEKKPA